MPEHQNSNLPRWAAKALRSIEWEDYRAVMEIDRDKVAFMSARDDGDDVVLCRDEYRNDGIYTISEPPFEADEVEMAMLDASDADLDEMDCWRA